MLEAAGADWPAIRARLEARVALEGSARAMGALRRRRGIGDAAVLLRLALVYAGAGLSLRGTAAWAAAAGVADLSDVALLYRLRGAEAWLGWLLQELLSQELAALAAPLAGRWRLRLVDGTTLAGPGGPAFRLHAAFDLGARRLDALELTTLAEAESLARLTAGPGELLIADRFYAKARGVHHVRAAGGHVILRRGLTACRLLTADGQRLDASKVLALARRHPRLDLPVLVPPPAGAAAAAVAARLILRRKPGPAAARARARAAGQARRQGQAARPKRLAAAEVLMLLTTLPANLAAADQVAALYRFRWQIELAFKRLKSLMRLDRLAAKEPRLARATLLARLILAVLTESLMGHILALSPQA